MQNPNDDTQWNDALRKHGIIPAKKEITEDQIKSLIDEAAQKRLEPKERDLGELSLEELELLEDEEDERALLAYRNQRIAEMQALAQKSKFGDVREIAADDWVEQVNKAGEGVVVIVHLFKNGIPLCSLLNDHFQKLAVKFKTVKFLKGQAQSCMPDFPDAHLPCVMVYRNGKVEQKYVGPDFWGNKPSLDVVEWLLAKKAKAFVTDLEADPRPKTRDVLMSQLKGDDYSDDSDD
ncbi:viral IAP-associated factor homolog [Galendromus occidentalis]|uniref:Viral IAP-associated factor homolog n=1 Tax=Galendromus occidentalis TaxID=34638 RepID=A0AAJ7P9V1_9ACAR|nr:viral IAP-associated factor homolog [Galendromus occidentalis]